MIKTNSHIHSNYSWDVFKDMDLETISTILKANNINFGTITDHVEFRMETLPEVLTKFKTRELELSKVNHIFQTVTLLNGAEISEPHLYPTIISELEELKLDCILGSIHRIYRKAKTDIEKRMAYQVYYNDILKMIELNQIDVVAHLDYINRYYDKDYSDTKQLIEIFSVMIEKGLALEINTSANRRSENYDIFPTIDKLELYFELGGDMLTIGSDAHKKEELTDNLDIIDKYPILKEKKIGIYKQRKFERI